MKPLHPLLIILTAAMLLAPSALRAAGGGEETDDVEMKLRAALQQTTQNLRTVTNTNAVLEAGKTEAETKAKDLQTKLDQTTKELAQLRNSSTNTISELNEKLAASTAQGEELAKKVEVWKAAFSEASKVAQIKENERATLERKNNQLTRVGQEHIEKNTQMFNIAMELLTRYKKFGLGDAIIARESLVAASKVRLQNLMQEYQTKLRDQRIIGQPPEEQAVTTAP